MSSRLISTDSLPSGWQLEVWGDSTVWIVSPDGRVRERLRSFVDTALQVSTLSNHDSTRCRWRKRGKWWTCEHGVQVDSHPNGYCDQGCCR